MPGCQIAGAASFERLLSHAIACNKSATAVGVKTGTEHRQGYSCLETMLLQTASGGMLVQRRGHSPLTDACPVGPQPAAGLLPAAWRLPEAARNLQAPAQQASWACCSDHHGCCHHEALYASDQTTGLVPCWAHHRPGERQPGSSHWGTQLQRGSCWGSDDVPAQPGCRCAAAPAPATLLQGTAVLLSAAGLLTSRHGARLAVLPSAWRIPQEIETCAIKVQQSTLMFCIFEAPAAVVVPWPAADTACTKFCRA